MKIKDLKIGTQLQIGFGIVFILVLSLVSVSWWQNIKLSNQTALLYEHPLKVRKAVDDLKIDVLSIHNDMLERCITVDEDAITRINDEIIAFNANANKQFDIFHESYLGPVADIDSLNIAFIKYTSIHNQTMQLFNEGESEKAIVRLKSGGEEHVQYEILMHQVENIETFAANKAESYYQETNSMGEFMNTQLFIFVLTILLLLLIVSFVLIKNIRTPLAELSIATKQFSEGEKQARSKYHSQNEFGVLSGYFNVMAESIETELLLGSQTAKLAEVMLSEDDAHNFCKTLLTTLLDYTESQIGAVYFLNDKKTEFDHFESIGLDKPGTKSFSVKTNEGEFGPALASGKMQHITNLPDDTRFIYSAVSGLISPREIITIPVVKGNQTLAVISLASIKSFSESNLRLLNSILITLSSRMDSIITYRKIDDFSKQLEKQNSELEAQKNELYVKSTELTEQNTELEMQKIQLEETSRLKTNFLSNMSHELRTPLNSVIALSGVLNRRLVKQIPEEEYSYLEVIQRNGEHLLTLINDILDISRIESGHEEIDLSKINVNNLSEEVVSMILPQAKQKNIDLIFIDGGTGMYLESDAAKCQHILQNIIGNAVKFTEQGKVEVTTKRNEKFINIIVSDTGIGISENNQQHIFDEFRQADGSTSRRFGGTGLGLAIAKKYTNMLGGSISISSKIGEGSTFTISLPIEYLEENSIKESDVNSDFKYPISQAVSTTNVDLKSKTILIVEDSEPAIIQIKDILEEDGYNILLARNGSEALEIISHTIPDAMILDLMMPGIDGFQVLKSLREAEQTAHVPVLILTAKHITKKELSFLTRNNVHQLIQKGDVKRIELQNAVKTMIVPQIDKDSAVLKLQEIDGKPLILIVEDNPDNMITARALLSDCCELIEASDAEKGIELARKYLPNLILMDIALPGMDGIEAFKIIRKDAKLLNIPVIALTASAMLEDREIILAHGFDAYVAKPIDEIVLFKTINDTLYG